MLWSFSFKPNLAFCVQFYSLLLVSPGVVYRGFFVPPDFNSRLLDAFLIL